MRNEGQADPRAWSILALLKACATEKNLTEGFKIHAYLREHNILERDAYVGSSLLNMYVKCGALSQAKQVLEELPSRDVVSWSALIAGYAQQGQGEEALKFYDRMQQEGHSPNAVTFTSALKACGSIRAIAKGKEIHDRIIGLGILEKDILLGTTLVDMYAKCGALDKAKQVLEQLPIRNAVTWSALIAGYAQNGQGEEALKCYDSMLRAGHYPDVVTFICALKACGSTGAAAKGKEIHDKIVSLCMLEKNIMLGNALVDMYAKCGALAKAHQMLEELLVRNVITWSILISNYAHHGEGEKALECFDSMLREGHSPDVVTIVCALKACGSIGATAKGREIHDKIVILGMLEKDIVLASALVDMYAKCGVLAKACQLMKELPVRSVATWNALIAGYAQQEQGEEALKCFDCMLCEGHSPDVVTFTCALKSCGSIGAVAKGEEIHDKILSCGMLEKDIVLGSVLVDMYAKCGILAKAHQVLKEVPARSVAMWNALIAGYVQQGQANEALKCFDDMLCERHSPNTVTFTCALKACGTIRATAKGEEIHDKIVSLGMLEKDITLGSKLVDMYANCGNLAKAQRVLEELPIRGAIMWNTLIAAFAQQGQAEEALKCFDSMLREGHSPHMVTFVHALKACGSIGAVAKGKEIHEKIIHLGMLEKESMLWSVLVEMYVKCGVLGRAQQVLEEIPIRDVATWNALVAGYAQQRLGEEAVKCFDCMLCEGHYPDVVTFTYAVKACGIIGSAAKGEEIYHMIVSLGMLEKDTALGNALVDMYGKCGALHKAQRVFNEVPVQDVVTWSALIAGYAQHGQGEEALKCFDNMLCQGYSPDAVTFTCALKACGSIGAAAKGEEIHDRVVSLGMLEKDIVLGNALVDMYAKCGALAKAQKLLKELPARNVVTWSALIAGYAQHGHGEEALKCFDSMLYEGHTPDAVTFISALKACGSIGAAAKGEEIHDMIGSLRLLEKDIALGCALVDMYAKCAAPAKAAQVLEVLPIRDVVIWNALVGGYAQQGQSLEAIKCFEKMQSKGVKPDLATFTCVLNACSHLCLSDQAETYFSEMSIKYGVEPDLEHYCCMVDLFARAGKFKEALSVIAEMPCDEYFPMWVALLGACYKWGEVQCGRFAFERALCLDKTDNAIYVLMANIYIAAGMQEDADKIEVMRMANRAVQLENCMLS